MTDRAGKKRRGASSASEEPRDKVEKLVQPAGLQDTGKRVGPKAGVTRSNAQKSDNKRETRQNSERANGDKNQVAVENKKRAQESEKKQTSSGADKRSTRSSVQGSNVSREVTPEHDSSPRSSISSADQPSPQQRSETRQKSQRENAAVASSSSTNSGVGVGRDQDDDNLTGLERLKSPLYDCFGHKLPTDPAEGVNKIIPYDLDEWKCDICKLTCANRVGLINHRKTHWKGKTIFKPRPRQPQPQAEERQRQMEPEREPQPNVEPLASTSQQDRPEPLTSQPHLRCAQSPLLAETADTTNIDAFAPMEDDLNTRKAKRLKEFSTSQLLEVLISRDKLHKCVCGAIFKDFVLFHLHRGTHHDEEPLRCSQCKEKMKDWYAFQTHFFQHKRKVDD